MSKNSAVCPKNVCVPASRKEVKKALKRVKTVARRTYVALTRKVTLTLATFLSFLAHLLLTLREGTRKFLGQTALFLLI